MMRFNVASAPHPALVHRSSIPVIHQYRSRKTLNYDVRSMKDFNSSLGLINTSPIVTVVVSFALDNGTLADLPFGHAMLTSENMLIWVCGVAVTEV